MRFQLFHGDCLEVLTGLADSSVDAIICDLPFGLTNCSWDKPLDLEALWLEYWRVLKPNCAIVLTAVQPYTSILIASQIQQFKYCHIWRKSRPSGFVHAQNMPLKDYEDICVFSKGSIAHKGKTSERMPYFPQGVEMLPKPRQVPLKKTSESAFATRPSHRAYEQVEANYPRQVLDFPSEGNTFHSTQKPVGLIEYLIKTYTREGDTVLDNTMGSGTTGVACANTRRRFIGIEKKRSFFEIAKRRIHDLPSVDVSDNPHVLGAQKTHFIRAAKQERAIQDAIKAATRQKLKITRTLIAEMVGLSREQVSKRYGHLFNASSGTELSGTAPSGKQTARSTQTGPTDPPLETSPPSYLRLTG